MISTKKGETRCADHWAHILLNTSQLTVIPAKGDLCVTPRGPLARRLCGGMPRAAPRRPPWIPALGDPCVTPVAGAVGRVKQTPPAWGPTLDSRFRGNDGYAKVSKGGSPASPETTAQGRCGTPAGPLVVRRSICIIQSTPRAAILVGCRLGGSDRRRSHPLFGAAHQTNGLAPDGPISWFESRQVEPRGL